MDAFPPPLPHGPITELFPDVFVVRGSFKIGPLLSIARNMTILRNGTELTLVNAVRLSAEGEAELEKLGTVKHLVKLGFFHNLDDPYCKSRFSPTFWSTSPGDAKTQKLENGGAGPFERARPFSFTGTKDREGALLLEQPQGNLLITCDSAQAWKDTEGCSLLGGLVTRMMGFIVPVKIGPIWLKQLTGGVPARVAPDFEALLSKDFKHLISGHGSLLRDVAKAELAKAWQKSGGASAA